jgi:hypothetical protein
MQGMSDAGATVHAVPATSHLPSLGVRLVIAVHAGLGLLSRHGYAAAGVEVLHIRLPHPKRRRRHCAAALAPCSRHAVSDLHIIVRSGLQIVTASRHAAVLTVVMLKVSWLQALAASPRRGWWLC